jgi:hypothetical protein
VLGYADKSLLLRLFLQVKVLFAVAGVMQPSVIFIDEIDSIMSARKADGERQWRPLKAAWCPMCPDEASAALLLATGICCRHLLGCTNGQMSACLFYTKTRQGMPGLLGTVAVRNVAPDCLQPDLSACRRARV